MNAALRKTPAKPVMIETPNYKGPERREAILVTQCNCHDKHTRILTDHDDALKQLRLDQKDGFKVIHDDLAHRREVLDKRIDDGNKELWDETKILERTKVPNRLFYVFVSAYSLLFIAGIVAVYQGMHNNSLDFIAGITELKEEQNEKLTKIERSVTVLQYESKSHSGSMNKMEADLEKVKTLILNGRK